MGEGQSELGARLKAERERLGLSQEDMAQKCGVSRPTQYRYETGRGVPDSAYFNAAAGIGVNVQLVLAGKGTLQVKLTPRETALIDMFRLSPPAVQNAVAQLLKGQALLREKRKAKPRKKAEVGA